MVPLRQSGRAGRRRRSQAVVVDLSQQHTEEQTITHSHRDTSPDQVAAVTPSHSACGQAPEKEVGGDGGGDTVWTGKREEDHTDQFLCAGEGGGAGGWRQQCSTSHGPRSRPYSDTSVVSLVARCQAGAAIATSFYNVVSRVAVFSI